MTVTAAAAAAAAAATKIKSRTATRSLSTKGDTGRNNSACVAMLLPLLALIAAVQIGRSTGCRAFATTVDSVAKNGLVPSAPSSTAFVSPQTPRQHASFRSGLSAVADPTGPNELVQAYQRRPSVDSVDDATSRLQEKLLAVAGTDTVTTSSSPSPVESTDSFPTLSSVDTFVSAARAKFDAATAAALGTVPHSSADTVGAIASVDTNVNQHLNAVADKAPALTGYLRDTVHGSNADNGFVDTLASTKASAAAAVTDPTTAAIASAAKAPTLLEYIRTAGGAASPIDSAAIENVHATNTFASGAQWQTLGLNTIHTIQDHGSFIVAGCAVIAMSGQKQAGYEAGQRKANAKIVRNAELMVEMADDMVDMSAEIKRLTAETATLRKEIRAAEADYESRMYKIKRERRQMAQRLLFMRRRVFRMKTKVERTEAKALRLEYKLQDRLEEKAAYVEELSAATRRVKDLIGAMGARRISNNVAAVNSSMQTNAREQAGRALMEPQMASSTPLFVDDKKSTFKPLPILSNAHFARPIKKNGTKRSASGGVPHFAYSK